MAQEILEIPSGYTEDQLLQKFKREIKSSLDFVQGRRQQFRDRYALYNNQRKQRDKISITTLYTTLNVLLAIYYTDEMTATMQGRKIGDDRAASNWERLARFDHDEMGMSVLNYATQWDRLFFGVGLRHLGGFDQITKTPIAYSLDPLSWLPDPSGDGITNNFRWHGFEVEMNIDAMTESLGFCPDAVKEIVNAEYINDENRSTKQARWDAMGFAPPAEEVGAERKLAYITNLFTTIDVDGVPKKYLVSLANNATLIVRMQELKAITEEEKKDPQKIPFPIALNYYSPKRGDPFGTNVGDLVEDKQRAQSILANVRMKVEQARLYPMYMYDRRRILNRRDLDFGLEKLIGVNGPVDASIIAPVPKDLGTTQSEKTLEKDIQDQVDISTGANAAQAGALVGPRRTASEVQQNQANANLRFILGSRINAWGERVFWKLWMRQYRSNFGAADTKIVRVNRGFISRLVELRRKDFVTREDPDIVVRSRLETRQEQEKELLNFQNSLPLILSDPLSSEASKRFAKRYLYKLQGREYEEIDRLIPRSPHEEWAGMENEFLSRNQSAKVRADEDHLSHIFIHAEAEETPSTQAHISAHRNFYIATVRNIPVESGAAPAGNEPYKAMGAQSQNQLAAQMASAAARPAPATVGAAA